jgi:hypothetical protein
MLMSVCLVLLLLLLLLLLLQAVTGCGTTCTHRQSWSCQHPLQTPAHMLLLLLLLLRDTNL